MLGIACGLLTFRKTQWENWRLQVGSAPVEDCCASSVSFGGHCTILAHCMGSQSIEKRRCCAVGVGLTSPCCISSARSVLSVSKGSVVWTGASGFSSSSSCGRTEEKP